MCTVASELGKFSKKSEVNMTLIGTKVINRKYDEITSYVNVGLFQNNGITCIRVCYLARARAMARVVLAQIEFTRAICGSRKILTMLQ